MAFKANSDLLTLATGLRSPAVQMRNLLQNIAGFHRRQPSPAFKELHEQIERFESANTLHAPTGFRRYGLGRAFTVLRHLTVTNGVTVSTGTSDHVASDLAALFKFTVDLLAEIDRQAVVTDERKLPLPSGTTTVTGLEELCAEVDLQKMTIARLPAPEVRLLYPEVLDGDGSETLRTSIEELLPFVDALAARASRAKAQIMTLATGSLPSLAGKRMVGDRMAMRQIAAFNHREPNWSRVGELLREIWDIEA